MLRVLCSESELDENGDVIAVRDHVSRPASRVENIYYGTELDTIEWRFDNDAGAGGEPVTTISGEVAAISAVYVRLTAVPGHGWTARLGSAHLEPLDTTASTRRIQDIVDWEPLSPPDERGYSYRGGYPRTEEGDEHLSGWVFTIASPQIEGNPSSFSSRTPVFEALLPAMGGLHS